MTHRKASPAVSLSVPLRARRGRRAALALALAAAALPAPFVHAAGGAASGVALPQKAASTATPGEAAPPAAQPAPQPASSAGIASAATGTAAGTTAETTAGAADTAPPMSDASREIRFGRVGLFRRLIPSPALEAQAAAEYAEIVRGAAHSDRLYPPTDPRVQQVQALVDRLQPYALKWSDRVRNWKWEVAVIRSPDIRMYCLPGGKIVVYSGLLDKVKLNENELGMLFGHEIAHAVREHVRERLGEQQEAQLMQGTVPQLFGLADLGVFPLGIGSQLFEMHYGRADETEADVIGSDIASRAGFDPRAAITLWDRLAAATRNDRDQGFIYVHPYTAARRDDILKRLPDMLPLYAKAIGTVPAALPDYEGMGVPRRRQPAAQR